jgi:hypothetical protein
MTKNLDQTWHSPMFSIWSAVEMNVAICCSCAPTLKGLLQRVWPQFLASLGSRYGSSGTSGREDSDATVINSTTSTMSNEYLQKPKENSQAESQSPQKSSHGLLGFHRSLFKPFSSGTNSSLASCYGSKFSEDDIMFDDKITCSSTRKDRLAPSKILREEKVIEVQTSVDQFVHSRLEPKPEAHRTIVGAGDNVKYPFDDDQEELHIQRAAWSSS